MIIPETWLYCTRCKKRWKLKGSLQNVDYLQHECVKDE